MKSRSLAAVAIAVSLTSSACSKDVASHEFPRPVFGVAAVGGCDMIEPGCPTHLLWSDGTVTLHHPRFTLSRSLAATAAMPSDDSWRIDPELPERLARELADADWPTIREQLPPGRCMACVDGIDVIVMVATADGEVALNSIETALELTVPEIATLSETAAAMYGIAGPGFPAVFP